MDDLETAEAEAIPAFGPRAFASAAPHDIRDCCNERSGRLARDRAECQRRHAQFKPLSRQRGWGGDEIGAKSTAERYKRM